MEPCKQEKNVIEMQTYISYNKEAMQRIEKAIEELKHDIKEGFEIQERKFAGKWVEKILIFVGTTIGTILICSIMYLIIKK